MFHFYRFIWLVLLVLHSLLGIDSVTAKEREIALYLECSSPNIEGAVWVEAFRSSYLTKPLDKACIDINHKIIPLQKETRIIRQKPITPEEASGMPDFGDMFELDMVDTYQVQLRFNSIESYKFTKATQIASKNDLSLISVVDNLHVSKIRVLEPLVSDTISIFGGESLAQALSGDTEILRYYFGLMQNGSIHGESRKVGIDDSVVPTKIKASLGMGFGIKYQLPQELDGKKIHIQEMIAYPDVGLTNPENQKHSKGEIFRNIESYHDNWSRFAFRFDKEWELQKGLWVFYVLLDGEEYISHEFFVY